MVRSIFLLFETVKQYHKYNYSVCLLSVLIIFSILCHDSKSYRPRFSDVCYYTNMLVHFRSGSSVLFDRCKLWYLHFIFLKSTKGGPGASGRVLPPVTGRSRVRVAVSSHCTGEGKACHWHPSSDPAQSRSSLHWVRPLYSWNLQPRQVIFM